MNDDEIRGLIINCNDNDVMLKHNREANDIRESFLDKIKNDLKAINNREEERINEELQLMDNIESLVTSNEFLNMFGCNEYKDKIERICDSVKLYQCKSKIQLVKIESSIHNLQRVYEQEYETFYKKTNCDIDDNIKGLDFESQGEINRIFRTHMTSKGLFNKLKNSGLI